VFSEKNRPGTLAHVAKVLGDSKVNILAFSIGTSGGGDVHLVVDDPNKAKKALSVRSAKDRLREAFHIYGIRVRVLV
jgi:hypothetical protein